jgi:hypothetical protein
VRARNTTRACLGQAILGRAGSWRGLRAPSWLVPAGRLVPRQRASCLKEREDGARCQAVSAPDAPPSETSGRHRYRITGGFGPIALASAACQGPCAHEYMRALASSLHRSPQANAVSTWWGAESKGRGFERMFWTAGPVLGSNRPCGAKAVVPSEVTMSARSRTSLCCGGQATRVWGIPRPPS